MDEEKCEESKQLSSRVLISSTKDAEVPKIAQSKSEQDWQIVDTVLPARIRAELPVVQSYPIVGINRWFFFV